MAAERTRSWAEHAREVLARHGRHTGQARQALGAAWLDARDAKRTIQHHILVGIGGAKGIDGFASLALRRRASIGGGIGNERLRWP